MDDALRPARHLSQNVPKHPEKSRTSESKPAVKQPPTFCDGKHGYKMRKLKNHIIIDKLLQYCYTQEVLLSAKMRYFMRIPQSP